MKATRIALILSLVVAVIYLGYQLHETREACIAKQARTEIEKVKARALAFYQLELGRKTLDHGVRAGGKNYELRIVIPEEKGREFKEWMKDTGFDLSFLTGRNMEYGGNAERSGELYWTLKYE